jgi:aminopeptidase-like protein
MHRWMAELYPLSRSITGDGVRATLAAIADRIPLEIRSVASGTPVLDWETPPEWKVHDAYIKDSKGRRIVDFRAQNLHLVGYSTPMRARLSLQELRPHLHSLPEHPEWIPYRTSYYNRTWGFCLPHRLLENLEDDLYDVCIDAKLEEGEFNYGECILPGESHEEVLISTHICHPSMANDNLSGIAIATALAERLAAIPRRYTYRFVFVPGTIGAITWLARNELLIPRIVHGLLLTGLGDPGHLTYKRSRRGDAVVDRVATKVLAERGTSHEVIDFSPYGYDERQYCSPGFDLPLGCLMRSRPGTYPEYHTSADNLEFVKPEQLEDALETAAAILLNLDEDRTWVNQQPKGEPQLGRRGLYRKLGGDQLPPDLHMAYLWILNLADGKHSLIDIAERSGISLGTLRQAIHDLSDAALIKEKTS